MTVVFSPLSLQAFFFFFFPPSQVHICYVVTGLSHKTCGCGYVKVHMLVHSVQLNVWFLPNVSNIFLCPLPLFFCIYHYCCAELLAVVAARL